MHHEMQLREVRNTGGFRLRQGCLLLSRVGPVNAQRQRHNRVHRDMVSGEKAAWVENGDYADYRRRAPLGRGFWAFPFPFASEFFVHHVYERALPRRFCPGGFDWAAADEAGCEAQSEAGEAALRAIRKRLGTRLVWHGGPFYARIRPLHAVGEQRWWRYERAVDFIAAARRELWCWQASPNGAWRCPVARDELELFIPAGGANAGHAPARARFAREQPAAAMD